MLGYKNPIWVMGNPPGTTLTTPQGSPCHALARPGATISSTEQDHDGSGAVRRWAAEGTPHGRSTGVRTIATSPPGNIDGEAPLLSTQERASPDSVPTTRELRSSLVIKKSGAPPPSHRFFCGAPREHGALLYQRWPTRG